MQLGNIMADSFNKIVLQRLPRGKPSKLKKTSEAPINIDLSKMSSGVVIDLGSSSKIKFIRGKYNRSCAVTVSGDVYVWGLGFKMEVEKQPRLIFTDTAGITDLDFGVRHGVYISSFNSQAYSWGDTTFGQTGNNYQDTHINSMNLICVPYSKLSKKNTERSARREKRDLAGYLVKAVETQTVQTI